MNQKCFWKAPQKKDKEKTIYDDISRNLFILQLFYQ